MCQKEFSKKEQEVILKILLSLNSGDSLYTDKRVEEAINQFKQLKEVGLKFED